MRCYCVLSWELPAWWLPGNGRYTNNFLCCTISPIRIPAHSGPAGHSLNNAQSLKLDLGTETYSGVSLNNLPADWHDYETLSITLFNPSTAPLTLTLRINDVAHDRSDHAYNDRYNTRLTLGPGSNTFTLKLADIENAPDGRSMDMSQVRRMGLFAVRLPEPRTVCLLDLRLD